MITSHQPLGSPRPRVVRGAETPEWLPIAAGAAIAFLALSRKSSLLGMGMLAGGGYLLYRAAINGSLQLPPDMLDRLKSQFGPLPDSLGGRYLNDSRNRMNEQVDEELLESFPASDPPANY